MGSGGECVITLKQAITEAVARQLIDPAPVPVTATLSAETIRESIPNLTQQERQELYKLLHDAFGCRMW